MRGARRRFLSRSAVPYHPCQVPARCGVLASSDFTVPGRWSRKEGNKRGSAYNLDDPVLARGGSVIRPEDAWIRPSRHRRAWLLSARSGLADAGRGPLCYVEPLYKAREFRAQPIMMILQKRRSALRHIRCVSDRCLTFDRSFLDGLDLQINRYFRQALGRIVI